MENQQLSQSSAEKISEIVVKNQHFCKYILNYNNFGDYGVCTIMRLVNLNMNIIYLDLSNNNLTGDGFI